MPYSLNMNDSQIEAARLEFPKTATRQYVYRLTGTVTGTTATELFIDGKVGRRIGIPANAGAVVTYDVAAFETVTATGAFASVAGSSNNIIGVSNNAGTVATVAGAAGTLVPAAQTIATVAVTADNVNKALVFTANSTTAANTKYVEVIARVVVANRVPAVTGAFN